MCVGDVVSFVGVWVVNMVCEFGFVVYSDDCVERGCCG